MFGKACSNVGLGMLQRAWTILLAAMALLGEVAPREVGASCDVIPPAGPSFRGTVANTNRPFARPGDWVTLTLDATCHGSSPGFSGTAADQVVTVVFTPPAGGLRNVVALAENCAAVDTATCAARPDVAKAVCFPMNELGAPVALDRLDQRTLRFRFPDTDAQLLPAADDLGWTGPATIAVTAAGQPLPCQLASSACSTQMGALACVDALFDNNGTRRTSRRHSGGRGRAGNRATQEAGAGEGAGEGGVQLRPGLPVLPDGSSRRAGRSQRLLKAPAAASATSPV